MDHSLERISDCLTKFDYAEWLIDEEFEVLDGWMECWECDGVLI